MPESTEQFSDETIRRFLLGSLTAAEQSKFDEQLFADDGLEKRVRLAECELADDYAYDRLDPTDRELFEQRFRVSAGRQQTVRVSEALRDRFASASVETAAAPSPGKLIGERLQRWLGLHQTPWKIALRVAVLILLIGTMWTVLRGPRIQRFIGIRQQAPAVTPVPNRQEANHPSKASPTPSQQSTPGPAGSLAGADPVTIMLFPQHGYDPIRITQVGFPDSQHSTLRLLLTLNENQELYRAELLTISGQSVFGDSLKPTGAGAIPFDVPARFLDAGDYQVKLRRVADGTEVATYYFRVQ